MPAVLNIRDIGEERKTALEEEARLRGVSIAEVVRECIDTGLAEARRARESAEWRAAAKAGLNEELRQLHANGPTLARIRQKGFLG